MKKKRQNRADVKGIRVDMYGRDVDCNFKQGGQCKTHYGD